VTVRLAPSHRERHGPPPRRIERRTTLVIVDDDELLRYGLQRRLEPHYDVVASVSDGVAAIDAVNEHHPDIVLLDISMPVMDGFETAERIARNCPRASIVFVTSHTDHSYVEEAFRRGAAGYVVKGSIKELQDAISTVIDGERYRPAFCR
jgi:DNA-binding NarL/FixJ family response regulator